MFKKSWIYRMYTYIHLEFIKSAKNQPVLGKMIFKLHSLTVKCAFMRVCNVHSVLHANGRSMSTLN